MKLFTTILLEALGLIAIGALYYLYQKKKIIRMAKEDLFLMSKDYYEKINKDFPLAQHSTMSLVSLNQLREDILSQEQATQEIQILRDKIIIDIEGLIKVSK